MLLKDVAVLVTGGGSGLGAATARGTFNVLGLFAERPVTAEPIDGSRSARPGMTAT